MQPARKSRHDGIQNATGAGRAPAPAALHTSRGNAVGVCTEGPEIQRVTAEGTRRVADGLQASSQASGTVSDRVTSVEISPRET